MPLPVLVFFISFVVNDVYFVWISSKLGFKISYPSYLCLNVSESNMCDAFKRQLNAVKYGILNYCFFGY